MGKIFGISDLPVTIFTSPLEQIKLKPSRKFCNKTTCEHDILEIKNKTHRMNRLNKFINGIREIF